jgi:hypothetical protein
MHGGNTVKWKKNVDTNFYFFIIIHFSIKPSRDPTSDPPRPWFGSRPEVWNQWVTLSYHIIDSTIFPSVTPHWDSNFPVCTRGGVKLCLFGTVTSNTSIVNPLDHRCIWSIGLIIMTKENWSTWKKVSPSATSSSTNLGLNMGLHGEDPVTTLLSQACTNPGWLNFVPWRLILVGTQCDTCFMSPFWHLEFWGGS